MGLGLGFDILIRIRARGMVTNLGQPASQQRTHTGARARKDWRPHLLPPNAIVPIQRRVHATVQASKHAHVQAKCGLGALFSKHPPRRVQETLVTGQIIQSSDSRTKTNAGEGQPEPSITQNLSRNHQESRTS